MMSLNTFIAATEEYNTFEKHVPAPYFRKVLNFSECVHAKLQIAVCGFYELYINGDKITKGRLAPYISNTNDIVYYDDYDVMFNAGGNVIGLHLGNGLQNNPGGYIWNFDKADFRSAPKFAISITYVDENGETHCIETDTSFKTIPSPIQFDDYRFGEHYDANKEIAEWNMLAYNDGHWNHAIITTPPTGELRLCEAEPIICQKELSAVSIQKVDEDKYIYDFGINCAGVCRLSVDGKKGQVISLQYGEYLKNDNVDMESIWFYRNADEWERDISILHKDIYTCKGEGREEYVPTFTYHGFRYVTVSGITEEQANEKLLTYLVMNSDLDICGGFSCSDSTINALQEMTVRSDLANFYYFPTDCPHREKNGWTGDAAISAEQMALNFHVENSFREWLRNICKTQREQGDISAVVPIRTGGGYGRGPAWDSVLVLLPYYAYIYKGDRQVVMECAPTIEGYLHYITERLDGNGLYTFVGGELGDWCHVGGTGDQGMKAPIVVTNNFLALEIAEKAAFLFREIRMMEQYKYATQLAKRLRNSMREHMVCMDTMTVRGECQTTQAMGLYYGLFEENEQERAFQKLIQLIEEQNGRMDIGVLGSRILFHVLAEFGQSEKAYQMIVGPDYPSYGYLVKKGATSLWECFFEEPKYSLNHHFWGDISAWFIKCLAGIRYNPKGNNLKSADIKPNFISQLQFASGYYDSHYGRVECKWERVGDMINVNVQAPTDFVGEIILPEGYVFADKRMKKILQTGTYLVKENFKE